MARELGAAPVTRRDIRTGWPAAMRPAPDMWSGGNRPGSTVLTTLAVLAPESGAGDSKYSLNCRDGLS